MTAAPSTLERDARALAAFLDRFRYAVLAILTLIYAAGAVAHAQAKPLWFDEIVTFIAATKPSVSDAWNVAQKIDLSPPLPHLLSHFAVRAFGSGDVAMRVPAIAGYWILCLCLFAFVRRRLGFFYGLAALLLPAVTELYTYSYEARAYGPEAGFAGLMLLSWQTATSSVKGKRLAACAVLSLSLMGAVMCHYYAVMLFVPLAGAELYRWRKSGRTDWAVWFAAGLGATPLVWRVAMVRTTVQGFSKTTWSPAYPGQILEFWEATVPKTLGFLIVALAIAALWRSDPDAPPEGKPLTFPRHELIAAALFLAIPACVVAAGVLVTHMFTPRYALIGLTGIPILLPALVSRLSGGRLMPAFILAILAFLPLGILTVAVEGAYRPFEREPELAQALAKEPVIIADGHLFLQLWRYAPPQLQSNLRYLVDLQSAAKYQGFDAIDGGIDVLRPWSTVPAMPFSEFAPRDGSFLIYYNRLKPGWILDRMVDEGATIQLERISGTHQLFRIHR